MISGSKIKYSMPHLIPIAYVALKTLASGKYFEKNSMAAQISDLPEEMLIEIFSLLDAKSVKNAALVCSE